MRTVSISGAGIAGPALAFWLKAADLEPTLVERAPALRHGGYVIDFWGLGYDLAERMGLLGEINRVGAARSKASLATRSSPWKSRRIASESSLSASVNDNSIS